MVPIPGKIGKIRRFSSFLPRFFRRDDLEFDETPFNG